MLLGGEEVRLNGYRAANQAGVFRVYQELSLVPNVPVFENLFLSHEHRFVRFGMLQRSAMIKRASELFEQFGHGWIDPKRQTGAYEFTVRQVIEIIKAFALAELLETQAPILLLDEPTAGLLHDETEFFSEMLLRVRDRSGIIFVTHRLSELLDLCDKVMVLKDGAVVASESAADLTEDSVHHLMVGRTRRADFYKEDRQVAPSANPMLRVRRLSSSKFADVSFDVCEGEILGIAGVLGSGKSELARALFDPDERERGSVSVRERELSSGGVVASMRARMGYVPPERHDDGALLSLPVSWNISLARISTATGRRATKLDLAQEKREASQYVDLLGIRTPGIGAPLRNLSGGNQQKVILARWLARGVDVLVLDNPTRGVDAGAKEEIYGILRDVTERGAAIVLIGDDLPELIGMSTRVILMKDGRIAATVETPVDAKPEEVELVGHIV
jgi:ribose transport system ATP-binding protein